MLTVLKARLKTFSVVFTRVYHAVAWPNLGVAGPFRPPNVSGALRSIYSNRTVGTLICVHILAMAGIPTNYNNKNSF